MQLHKPCGSEIATAFTHSDGHFLYCSNCDVSDLLGDMEVINVCDQHCIENCNQCEEQS